MGTILSYIKKYFYEIDKMILLLVSLLTALLIYLNYHFRIDHSISQHHSFTFSFISRYFIFLAAFALPYLLYHWLRQKKHSNQPLFLLLLLVAPAIFSLKVALDIPLQFSDNHNWNDYWNNIFYWPMRLIIVAAILFI